MIDCDKFVEENTWGEFVEEERSEAGEDEERKKQECEKFS